MTTEENLIHEAETKANEVLKASTFKHAIYAWKSYNKDGDVDGVYIYGSPVLLNDDEFYKRTDEAWKNHDGGVLIYALHR